MFVEFFTNCTKTRCLKLYQKLFTAAACRNPDGNPARFVANRLVKTDPWSTAVRCQRTVLLVESLRSTQDEPSAPAVLGHPLPSETDATRLCYLEVYKEQNIPLNSSL